MHTAWAVHHHTGHKTSYINARTSCQNRIPQKQTPKKQYESNNTLTNLLPFYDLSFFILT